MLSDNLIVLFVQSIIVIVLFKVNSLWYNTERVKRIMSWALFVTIIVASISAFGRLKVSEADSLLILVLGNLVFLQLFVQTLSLLIKSVVWIYDQIKNTNTKILISTKIKIGHLSILSIVILLVVLISTFLFFQRIRLTDCELNFIEGTGISKKAYRRIQDDIRDLTMKELHQVASAIPEDSYEYNLKNSIIKSVYFRECLKDSRILNTAEKAAITDSLLLYDRMQEGNFNRQNQWLSTNIVNESELNEIRSNDLALKVWNWLDRGHGKSRISAFLKEDGHSKIEFEPTLNKLISYHNLKAETKLRIDSLNSNYVWDKKIEKLLVTYSPAEVQEVLLRIKLPYSLK